MNQRFFGFNTQSLKLPIPESRKLEKEMQDCFGPQGFQSSLQFSQNYDEILA